MELKFRPSSAHRWFACPASVRMESHFGTEKTSYASYQGSLAHKLAGHCLINNFDPSWYLGESLLDDPDLKVDKEMIEHVQTYLEHVWKVRNYKSTLLVEQHLTHTLKNGISIAGTCDAMVVDHISETIHVIDFKYGLKIVHLTLNEQLYLYALLAHKKFKFDDIRLYIIQPKANNYPFKFLNKRKLEKFERKVQKKSYECMNPNPTFVVGDHCTYCKAQFDCPAIKKPKKTSRWSF